MTEHEKLKKICDEIGYNGSSFNFWDDCITTKTSEFGHRIVDVREIIFTTEFRMLCMGYLQFTQSEVHFDSIMEYLDNPVDYLLYNIILG